MRRQKKKILKQTEGTGLTPIRANCLDEECGTHVMFSFADAAAASRFAKGAGGTVAIDTGRHVYTAWDPILRKQGAHHPALNPYNLKENKDCRMDYSEEMCAASLDILRRTVFIRTHPDFKTADVNRIIQKIKAAAAA